MESNQKMETTTDIEQAKLNYERWRFEEEMKFKKWQAQEEIQFKQFELQSKKNEAVKAKWSSPILVAIVGLFTTLIISIVQNYFQSKATRELEKQRFESTIIQKALELPSKEESAKQFAFLLDIGLISDQTGRLKNYVRNPESIPLQVPPELSNSQTASRKGINNTPPPDVQKNLLLLKEKIIDPIEKHLGYKVSVSSGYRSRELNEALGGDPGSLHITGQEVDIDLGSKALNLELACWIAKNLDFNVLKNEFDNAWVSISYKREGNENLIEGYPCSKD